MSSTDGNVYEIQKKQILSLDIPLGARFRDEDIAEQLGVSCTPVREAIRRDRLILIGSLGILLTEK
jgi:DNA-binding GntR family transcriptional regulator